MNKNTKKKNLVRCLVCGEVFDASLEFCPVCGVGCEQFEPYEEEEVLFRNDTNERYLILGGGAAALSAAKAIRERDKTGTVVLVSQEETLPYNRPMLTKSLAAPLAPECLLMEPESWFEENSIYPMLGKTVASVDTESREILLSSGEKLSYTRLIYALGAESFLPPFAGSDLDGIVTIRTLADVQAAHSRIRKGGKAVVIGGGVLGLEAAWELKRSDMDVTVLEHAPRLMPRQLNQQAAKALTDAAAKAGVHIFTNVQVTAAEGSDRVIAVDTADGSRFEAELVIVSAGVRANVSVAQQMGLTVERAVVVDDHMKAAPGIYACGDCAQLNGLNLANWPQALDQGKVAGANAAGDDLTYERDSLGLSFSGFGISLYAAGSNSDDPNIRCKILEFQDQVTGHYRRLTFTHDKLTGVVLLGDVSAMKALTSALEAGHSYQQVLAKDLVF